MTRADINFSRAVRLVFMLALVMVGFAHKPVMAVPLPVQLAAYVPCITDDGIHKSDPNGVVHDYGCNACRLAATVLVPLPPEVGAVELAYSYAASLLERQAYLVRRLYPPSSGPRAPPHTVTMS